MINDFDRFFLNLPPLDKEKDFNAFWNQSFAELKRIPMNPLIENSKEHISEKFNTYDAVFQGAGKYKVKGILYVPKDYKNPKVIIMIHDYNLPFQIDENILDSQTSFFFLQLRGHELLYKYPVINPGKTGKEEKNSPGYLTDNILEPNNFYVKNIYLDASRSIDFLRLSDKVECDEIGMFGKGMGAAAAVFASGFSNRIRSLVLDSPSFCYLDLSQNISKSDAANEINSFISANQSKKKLVKKTLSYFDAINLSEKINIPTLAAVGLRDTFSPPECVFALFNHLKCEKTIEVYPEDDHSAGGRAQFMKAVEWSKKILKNS